MKSTVPEIRQRFDADVERFSNLETVQSATVDAPLAMALIAQAAAATTPLARQVLDVGCGAGNYTLKLLERIVPGPATHVEYLAGKRRRSRRRLSDQSHRQWRIDRGRLDGFKVRESLYVGVKPLPDFRDG